MTVAVYMHDDCLGHDTGAGHPERAGRLRAIEKALRAAPFAKQLAFIAPPLGDDDALLLAHAPEYVAAVRKAAPKDRPVYLDGDTVMSPGSLQAALRAAGAAVASVDAVIEVKYTSAFCAVRPPGHHATHTRAMGFCIFNNIAIAARHALERHGLERIAIVDFDVHHGNGTEDILRDEPRALYISAHQSPLYPGTGGVVDNSAHILNVPLPGGTDGAAYRRVFEGIVLPALDNFAPQLLLTSAGFDAHRDDPLAGLALTEADYAWIGTKLKEVAERHCGGRLISFLEGGYDLGALAASAAAYVGATL